MDSQRRRPGRGSATHDGRRHWPGRLSCASAWWGCDPYLQVAVLACSVEWIGMLDIFHPAQGAAISGTRASVLGAWRAQRREDGTSVTRRHWQQGERDQAPVYTVEATDWLLPVPGRVPAVGGRDGAMPVVTESRGKLRNCWDDSLRIRRAACRPIQLAVGQYVPKTQPPWFAHAKWAARARWTGSQTAESPSRYLSTRAQHCQFM